MDKKAFFEEIKRLVEEGKVSDAIKELIQKVDLDQEIQNRLRTINSSYKQVKNEFGMGKMGFGEFSKFHSQSVSNTLGAVTEIEEEYSLKQEDHSPNEAIKSILFLGANPNHTARIGLGTESINIAEMFMDSKDTKFISFFGVNSIFFQKILRKTQPQILHLSAHTTSNETKIILHSRIGEKDYEILSLAHMVELIKALGIKIECFFINNHIEEVQAYRIIRSGIIDNFIFANERISNSASILFANSFYDSLKEKHSYEDAVKFGNLTLQLEFGFENQVYEFLG